MRKIVYLVAVILAFAGCGNEKSSHTDAASSASSADTGKQLASVTMDETTGHARDAYGHTIEVRPYQRMVVASLGAVETLYLIGGEDAIAAIATSRGGVWPEEKTAALPSVGNVARPSFETIISFDPDIVILSAMSLDIAESLSGHNIPVFIHDATSIEDIFASVELLGDLSAKESAAEALIAEKRARLAEVASAVAKRTVRLKGAFLYSANPVMGFTNESLPGEILNLLGVTNIAVGLSGKRPIISSELLVSENPDFLFISMSIENPEALLSAESAVARTRAGREGHISTIPSSLILRPSPRIVDGISTLQEILAEIPPASEEG
ncbi:ABC transporter substrate-binding protein [Sediminispirochaeta bajacaliforniensis]|uniref:ABC transporter substrate-binding protein n=1 Tax=Sediminispirochaeta bajacaliforniensis TaxID=148 RepID=UPI000368E1E4|nr:ABC transporter substrate-binding protein [Sediminispirochaeta bajacaliforniensis]